MGFIFGFYEFGVLFWVLWGLLGFILRFKFIILIYLFIFLIR